MRLFWKVVMCMSFFCGFTYSHASQLRILTDRTESHLTPLIEKFEQEYGQKIKVLFVGKGLVARVENRPQEADIVIVKTADILELLKKKGLLRPFQSDIVKKNIPEAYRDRASYYTGLTYRARAIFFHKRDVPLSELNTYLDLASPKWKGKVCLRSGYHTYNLSLFSQIAYTHGIGVTRDFLVGLKKNLARPPKGNDRAQVKAIFHGICKIAIANSYYMGIMLGRDDQRAWGEAAKVFFPDQKGRGSFILMSGAALTSSSRNSRLAEKFLEFLTMEKQQDFLSKSIFAYAINSKKPLSGVNRLLGKEQGLQKGVFKKNVVPLEKIAEQRSAIIKILDEINFDSK